MAVKLTLSIGLAVVIGLAAIGVVIRSILVVSFAVVVNLGEICVGIDFIGFLLVCGLGVIGVIGE